METKILRNKQPLSEFISFRLSKQQINEAVQNMTSGKPFYVTGILQSAGKKNQNGRVYPREVLIREANRYGQNEIQEGRAYGELDHPDSQVVNVKNASHTIEELWWDGDNLMGKLEILDTPSGNIVRNILLAGKTLGISSRGLGSVKQVTENTVEVQDDFELICWDFVSNPSTRGAFMKPLREGTGNQEQLDKYFNVHKCISEILFDSNI